LDLAVELWEDDGGYDEAAKAIAGIAAAVAASSNPYVIGAGVALGLIAGLVGILDRSTTMIGTAKINCLGCRILTWRPVWGHTLSASLSGL
jgi:hypothetical protein